MVERPVAVAGAEAPAHAIALCGHLRLDGLLHAVGQLLDGRGRGGVEQDAARVLAIGKALRDHVLDGIADRDGEQDDLVTAGEMLANLCSLDVEGWVGLHDLLLAVVVVELPDAVWLGEQAGVLAGILDEAFIKILGAHEPRIAARLLRVNLQQWGIVDRHGYSSP